MVEKFRVHSDLKTGLHPKNEVDSFVLRSIIQLHLSKRSLTSVLPIEFVKAARRLEKSKSWTQASSFKDIAQLAELVLVIVQLISCPLLLNNTHTPSLTLIGFPINVNAAIAITGLYPCDAPCMIIISVLHECHQDSL